MYEREREIKKIYAYLWGIDMIVLKQWFASGIIMYI